LRMSSFCFVLFCFVFASIETLSQQNGKALRSWGKHWILSSPIWDDNCFPCQSELSDVPPGVKVLTSTHFLTSSHFRQSWARRRSSPSFWMTAREAGRVRMPSFLPDLSSRSGNVPLPRLQNSFFFSCRASFATRGEGEGHNREQIAEMSGKSVFRLIQSKSSKRQAFDSNLNESIWPLPQFWVCIVSLRSEVKWGEVSWSSFKTPNWSLPQIDEWEADSFDSFSLPLPEGTRSQVHIFNLVLGKYWLWPKTKLQIYPKEIKTILSIFVSDSQKLSPVQEKKAHWVCTQSAGKTSPRQF
jgi:hypothetical protein